MSEERINKLEMIAERHDGDINRIATSLEKLVEQGDTTNKILQESLIRDERIHGRIDKLEARIFGKIEVISSSVQHANNRLNKYDSGINKLVWTVFTVIIIGLLGLLATSSH